MTGVQTCALPISVLAALEALAEAYQRADVDTATDHYDVSFYLDVVFADDLEAPARRAA